MVVAILAASTMVMHPARPVAAPRATAIARARIVTAPRLDLRAPPKRIAGAQRSRRTIDFE